MSGIKQPSFLFQEMCLWHALEHGFSCMTFCQEPTKFLKSSLLSLLRVLESDQEGDGCTYEAMFNIHSQAATSSSEPTSLPGKRPPKEAGFPSSSGREGAGVFSPTLFCGLLT